MNKWKWIIGIALGLVILAVLMGVGFMVRSNFHGYRAEALDARCLFERGPGIMPYGGFGFHMRGPGMMGRSFMPFGGFFGGLLSLGILTLAVLGIIWLVRSLRLPRPVDVSAAAPAVVDNPCKKCGRPIQDDWAICPYCGKKV